MKTLISLLVLCVFLATVGAAGEKADTSKAKVELLKWTSFNAGLAEAKKNDKKILVDFYTDWCGWCKRLDKDTYGNDKVAGYLKDKYVAIKVNAESGDTVRYKNKVYSQSQLAQSFGVSGYPTIVFFDSNGDVINSLPGYLPPERFLPVIQFIGENQYKKMSWEEYQKKK